MPSNPISSYHFLPIDVRLFFDTTSAYRQGSIFSERNYFGNVLAPRGISHGNNAKQPQKLPSMILILLPALMHRTRFSHIPRTLLSSRIASLSLFFRHPPISRLRIFIPLTHQYYCPTKTSRSLATTRSFLIPRRRLLYSDLLSFSDN